MDIRLLTGQGCRGLPVHREVRGQPPQPALEGGVPDHQTVRWLLHAQHQERVVRGREALLRNGLQQGSSRPRDVQARNKERRG